MGTRKLGFSALMTAIYLNLNTTEPLTNTYTFYNHVPRNATMPYHVISQPLGRESLMFNTRDTEAEENIIQIDSWFDETSGKGDKPCADAMNNIVQGMTNAPLVMITAGYDNSYLVFLDFANILKDDTESGKIIRHGTLRFRVHMAPT
ncbi:unnamed protein product [marine sediment metagenome]|uniref:Uncharacterized protein n=1 Tax=marine sediment metagenome TaxID=412755 RepID=X1BIX7_9ZZZZ